MKNRINLSGALPSSHENADNIEGTGNAIPELIIENKISHDVNFLNELFVEAIDGIIIWDTEGNVMKANAAACSIFECSQSEILGRNVHNLCTVDEVGLKKINTELQQTGAIKSQILLRISNGKEKWLEFTCKSHKLEGYITTIFRDITDRYKMEKELQESEQKFRRIFEDSMDGLILWDDQYQVVDINGSAEKMFGITRDKLIGCNIFELLKQDKKPEIINHLEKATEKGKNSSTISFELPNGKIKHFDYSTKLGIIDGLNQTVIIDVTDKVELQEHLRKSDRLNIIGELAAGIAHEIRNPMTALKGFIQLLEPNIKADNSMYYDVITTELARIDSIINEFLILAKPQAICFQMKDISQIMKETVDLLNAQAVLYNVQIIIDFEANLPLVYCEPNQLKKVFINIIKNAIEVMPNGGNIRITIKRAGDNIHISIQDEGCGIPKEKIKKLGEPFYTTKERGTGLGLMVSYRIIEEHKGDIDIKSVEGKGTTFNVILPVDHKNN